jgi:hypothetical protein
MMLEKPLSGLRAMMSERGALVKGKSRTLAVAPMAHAGELRVDLIICIFFV